jgi:hypothetical protein
VSKENDFAMLFFVFSGHGIEKCGETHALMEDG